MSFILYVPYYLPFNILESAVGWIEKILYTVDGRTAILQS